MDVLFAVLPFADVGRPAIGVSLLQAAAARLGFSARVYYGNFDFAEAVGLDLYGRLANAVPDALLGEWFFADLLFGDQLPDEQAYESRVLARYPEGRALFPDILKARRLRQAFLDRCAAEIGDAAPRVVGFTTTFHQTCACLAVAARLKRSPAPPLIVFGGANCEGEMGLQLLRSCAAIDYVCTREGDVAFSAFLQRLLRDGDPRPLPGILRRGESTTATSPELVRDLDGLPIPDYIDYFRRLEASPLRPAVQANLLIETSRGCWWGEKSHCTFCGLNGEGMAFRGKSPERVLRELRYLTQTHGLNRVECVDNILDMRYLTTLFPQLAAGGPKVELFYETKANLKWHQLRTLYAGGVRAIQPGVESLSTEVLRRMRKGCTALQNLQLLRWCEELGIGAAWNILFGFPGEPASEYERMAQLLPLLAHLPPPASCCPFRLDRFSPYFNDSKAFGLVRVRPNFAYYYVFPFGRRDLERLAYYFEFDYADGRDPTAYTGGLQREVRRWWAAAAVSPAGRPRLDCLQADDLVLVADTRPCAVQPRHRLQGLEAAVHQQCDTAQTLASLRRGLGGDPPEWEVRRALDKLRAARLIAEADGQYLSLAVLRNRAPHEMAAGAVVPCLT
jgi:ribosomal peptide maturation radical SAM protein 1